MEKKILKPFTISEETIKEIRELQESKEQINAQKRVANGIPPFYGKTNGYLVNSFCCGKCKQVVAIAPHQAKYCMHCGTKINWEKEGEPNE